MAQHRKRSTSACLEAHLGVARSDTTPEPSTSSLGDLAELLMSDDDSIATGAAYELGTTSLGLDLLFEKFVSDDISVRSIAAYGIVHAGKSAVPRLLELIDQAEPGLQLRIIDVIGDIGIEAEDAVGRLVSLSNSEDVQVRRGSRVLGLIAQAYKEISNELIQALSKALVDEDAIVVRNATFSISQLGAAAAPKPLSSVSTKISHTGITTLEGGASRRSSD